MTENSTHNENEKLKVVFFGTPEFVIPIAQSLASHFDLVGVVTAPDSMQGRKKIITPSPVKQWYMEYLLKKNKEGVILTPDKLTKETAVKLTRLHADIFITAAYGKLVPKRILDLPPLGALNIHPSTLPKYRGPSPIQYALLNNESKLGITLMQMDEELDHGAILTQWKIPIETDDTFETLHTKAFSDAAEKLPELLYAYKNGTIIPIPQNHTEATFTEKVEKQDGFFSFDNPPDSQTLKRMIHAYYPWPTTWSTIEVNGKEVRIKLLPQNRVQLEGGKPMDIKDLRNGHPDIAEKVERILS